MGASVRIEGEAFSDERFSALARLAGLADDDHARGKMCRIWRQCTAMNAHILSDEIVISVFGACGPDALIRSGLGERVSCGKPVCNGCSLCGLRIAGTRGRIEWLEKVKKNAKKGGQANKSRLASHRLTPGGSLSGSPGEPRQEKEKEKETLSLGEGSGSGSPPSPEPPDLGRGGDLEQRLEASLRSHAAMVGSDAKFTAPLPPESAMGTSWRRRQVWWELMRAEHEKLRSTRMDPTAQPLPPRVGGQVERDMVQCEKDLVSQGLNELAIDAKFRHVIAYARDEAAAQRTLQYFVPRLLFEPGRFARTVDTPLSAASRRRGPQLVDVTGESRAEEQRLLAEQRREEQRAIAAEIEHRAELERRERLEGKKP